MNNKTKQLTLFLGVIGYMLSTLSASVDAVICYGADGHVAIEPAHSDCCARYSEDSKDHKKHPGTGDPGLDQQDNCCTDIPLSSGENDQYTVNSGKNLGFKSLINLYPTPSSPQALCLDAPAVFESQHSNDNPISTIILLI